MYFCVAVPYMCLTAYNMLLSLLFIFLCETEWLTRACFYCRVNIVELLFSQLSKILCYFMVNYGLRHGII